MSLEQRSSEHADQTLRNNNVTSPLSPLVVDRKRIVKDFSVPY